MARFKLAKGKSSKKSDTRGLIPCLLLIVSGIVILSLLFYMMLRSAGGQ